MKRKQFLKCNRCAGSKNSGVYIKIVVKIKSNLGLIENKRAQAG